MSVLLKEYRPKEVPIFQRSSRQMGMSGKINLVTRRVVRLGQTTTVGKTGLECSPICFGMQCLVECPSVKRVLNSCFSV